MCFEVCVKLVQRDTVGIPPLALSKRVDGHRRRGLRAVMARAPVHVPLTDACVLADEGAILVKLDLFTLTVLHEAVVTVRSPVNVLDRTLTASLSTFFLTEGKLFI